MSYSQTATNGKNESTSLELAQKHVSNLALQTIWSGSASTALTTTLDEVMNKLDTERGRLSIFFSALDLLDVYKQNKTKIAQLKFQLMCISDDEKHADERAAIQSQINQLEQENQRLKTAIQGMLASIVSIDSTTSIVGHDVQFDYITGINELLNAYDHILTAEEKAAGITILRQLGGRQSLAEFYNQVDENGNVIEGSGYEYIMSVVENIKNTYSGREAAVNTALAILKLAADKNVKLDYEHKGTSGYEPYVSTASVLTGVDCNPWTSYCVDKGTTNGFQWRPVPSFYNVGENLEDWTKAQPGDVFVNSGHVGIIIENDPTNNQMVVAEAKGQAIGIVLNVRSYNNLKSGGYSVRDMTNVYNGTENTDRSAFDQYIDTENYERVSL